MITSTVVLGQLQNRNGHFIAADPVKIPRETLFFKVIIIIIIVVYLIVQHFSS